MFFGPPLEFLRGKTTLGLNENQGVHFLVHKNASLEPCAHFAKNSAQGSRLRAAVLGHFSSKMRSGFDGLNEVALGGDGGRKSDL